MSKEALLAELKDAYGFVLEEPLLEEMAQAGIVKHLQHGDQLMDIGDKLTHMPMLLSGAIKILSEDKEGNELLIYYLEMGDTCAMTLTCCMGNKKSPFRAIAEDECSVILIPGEYLDQWLCKYKSWKEFVFQSFEIRMNEFLESLESVAFMNMDERILKYLRDKAMVNGSTTLHATHQEIAQDLHTSRVVVSRLLKKLENEEVLKIFRNRIELLKL